MPTQGEKGTKNNFYLKQQLNNRGKHHSKDRSSLHKATPMVVQEEGGQHRKNHSVVINRERQLDQSPERSAHNGKALKLPGMQYSEPGTHLSMY